MKILVTGSDGFIGKKIVESYKKEGHQVLGLDIKSGFDLKDKDLVNSLDEDFDFVYHLAAYNGTKWFYEDPINVIRDNIFPTENILKKFSGKVKKIIFSGTCESYAGSTDYFNYQIPTDEKVPLTIVDPKNLRWSYGGSKLLNEIMIWSYSKEYNQTMTILRYHNVYGPGQKDHFIPDFIERAKKNDFKLFGYLNTRSFIYLDDAIDITKKIIISNASNNKTINIGNENEVSIEIVAKKIMSIMNIDKELILKDAPEGSVSRRCPDCSLQKKILKKNYSFTTLEEGLKKIILK